MAATSSATTVWAGDLAKGSGTTTPASGAFPPVDVSWASRTKRAAGKTSPEELLAAAEAFDLDDLHGGAEHAGMRPV